MKKVLKCHIPCNFDKFWTIWPTLKPITLHTRYVKGIIFPKNTYWNNTEVKMFGIRSEISYFMQFWDNMTHPKPPYSTKESTFKGSYSLKVLLKSFWPIHIDEFFKSPYKMKSNDTKFTMIEKAILILLMICFSDWWRHLLFSLIRKTLDNQYFRKILGNKTLCKQNIFLKKVQSYKQKYTIIIFS